MDIKIKYDKEFDLLMISLKEKYGEKMFELDGIGSQLDISQFSKKFFTTNVTADSSVDANANVDDNSVIAYNNELPKPYFKLNSYYMLWKRLKKQYSKEIADDIIEKQLSGDIYINDMGGIGGGLSYCYNYSTYDVMMKGLPMIKKIKSVPPKYLYSFKSQIEQFTIIAANSTLGATGLADFLVVMSYYAKNIINTLSDANFSFKDEESAWHYIKENISSFVYTVNQPSRGNQSCFTNISIYDDVFLASMKEDYLFPDGTTLDIEMVQRLQDIFLSIMNEEMERTPITFPVTTACFSVDEEKNILDKKFLTFISKHNQKYGFINIYCGSSSTLSSCCFHGSQLVTVKNEKKITTLSLSEGYKKFGSKIINVKYLNEWSEGRFVKIDRGDKKMFIITLEGEKEPLILTEDHINVTKRGEVITSDLSLDDELVSFNEKTYEYSSVKIKSIDEYVTDIKNVYCFEMIDKNEPYFSLPNGIITHNCRLRSDKNNEYFNSFGAGSSKIGSIGVVTVNLPRLAYRFKDNMEEFHSELTKLVNYAAKINNVKRKIVQDRIKNGNHPLYEHGFLNINTQYSTVGINGFNECVEIFGKDILSDDGIKFGIEIIATINKENDIISSKLKMPHNCEQIPGESVSVKQCIKDKVLKFHNDYEMYSNQFIPLTTKTNLLNRIKLQGIFDKHFSGGAIAHLNVDTQIEDVQQIADLIEYSAKMGVIYFAINYVLSECEDGHMSVTKGEICPICGKQITNQYSRVVGFLTNTKSWNKTRREFDFPNRQFYNALSF